MAASTLATSDAVLLVRKNLDEVGPNNSVMYGTSQDETSDNNSIDDIIKKNLPEAINEIHKAAPAILLDGIDYINALDDDGDTVSDFLRFVACVDEETGVAVTRPLPEDSAEAQKQANPYIKGTADRPRLVQCLGGEGGAVKFKYYGSTATLYYIKQLTYSAQTDSYKYSSQLKQNIIDWLTAKVLETYNDARAQAYYQRALTFHP